MFLSIITVLFVVSPFSLAASFTCSTSNAISWAESGSTTGGTTNGSSGTSSSDPCAEYANNPKALQVCYEMQSQGECNAVGGSACDGDDDDDEEEFILRTRDTLSCYSDETCYEYTDGSLFCLDEETGDYADDVGGSGNVNTGVYTGPDGSQTTVEGASATSSNTRSSSSSATDSDTRTTSSTPAAMSSSTSSGSRPVGVTGSVTSSASATAPTANLGVRKVRPGSAMGVLGLIVALI
ncbi:hypothetical protein BCON_0010g00460 [Botryotinia convoluta]|uniref:Ig-like domain-containing protein n=1 Tax=Botryotinia convoluta TaxID=54673 RepID=A0A4Z1IX27_9HELO|nr:hypothetical protein BCON_0010g00460 [Botryotinia convoluta]